MADEYTRRLFILQKNSRRYEEAACNAAVYVAICPAKAKVNTTFWTVSLDLRRLNTLTS